MRWTPAIAGVCFWASAAAACAQTPSPDTDVLKAARQPLAPEWALLGRIKAKAAENLNGLPNYTCLQTIEREKRAAHARKFEPWDTLRLEVALVANKELFSWPGERRFEERSIADITGGTGAIGNGAFALHARSIFLTRAASFTYVGEETLDSRRAIRYDYKVPQMLSSYQISVGGNRAFVAYYGSFWVDTRTFDLIRLDVRADEIPPGLNIREAGDTMEYQRERIGEADFLLPKSSELVMVDLFGNTSRNRTQFSACRQYTGESTLSFDDSPETAAPPEPAAKPVRLPAGVKIDIRLETPIRSGSSAIGDAVKAVLSRDARWNGEVVAPKGAVLTGRINQLERARGFPDYYRVGLDFSTIEFEGKTGEFRALLEDAGILEPVSAGRGRMRAEPGWQNLAVEPSSPNQKTGGLFVVIGSRVNLGRGHSMTWRTVE